MLTIQQEKGLASRHEKNYELQFLQHVRDADPNHPGYNNIVHLLDSFHYEGPHGKLLCIITEVTGENLWKFAQRSDIHGCLPSFLVRILSRQLLLGLDYLHSCKIIHTGACTIL